MEMPPDWAMKIGELSGAVENLASQARRDSAEFRQCFREMQEAVNRIAIDLEVSVQSSKPVTERVEAVEEDVCQILSRLEKMESAKRLFFAGLAGLGSIFVVCGGWVLSKLTEHGHLQLPWKVDP